MSLAASASFLAKEPTIQADAGNRQEREFEGRLNADRALEQGEDGLQIRVAAIDAVIELAAFCLRAEKAFLLKSGKLAGDVGRVGFQRRGQLADVGARVPVDVEERQQLAAEFRAEREHCSIILLHLQ